MRNYQLYIKIFLFCWLLPLSISAQNHTDAQGKKTGPWKVKYSDGTPHYEAIFEKGQPIGLMKRYNEMGELTAEMNFMSNSSKCYARLYSGGKHLKAEGLYINQKKDSIWKYFRNDGSISMKENYVDGFLSGLTESYYPSGKIAHVYTYNKGKKNGLWTQYFENGNMMQSCNYKNNLLHGHYEACFPEGGIEVSGTYVRDLLDGDWKYFSEEGELKQTLKYVIGEIQNPDDLQENYNKFIKHIEDNIGNIPDPDDGDF